jgi:hypothetical protein
MIAASRQRLSLLVTRYSLQDTLLAALFALASFALYAATSAPSVATLFDDSLEFQVVLPTLGIAHPSGYPLYTLLGKLFTLICPFRDLAGRANLFSALAAAITVGVLYLVAKRASGSRPAAAAVTLAFAISPVWWSQATIAEVYALHGLLAALFLWLLLRWEDAHAGRGASASKIPVRGKPPCRRSPSGGGTADENKSLGPVSDRARPGARGGSVRRPATAPWAIFKTDRWLILVALVFGLGLAHHRTIALLLPAALVFVLWTDPTLPRRPRRWPPLLLCTLAPLLLYLYLPIRGRAVTSLDGTFTPTLQGTLDWIMAHGYNVFLTGNPFNVSRDAGFFGKLFLDQFGVLLLLAAVLELVTAWRSGVRRYLFLLLATAAQVLFGVVYKVEDVAVFFIPAFMLTALWAGMGLARAVGAVRELYSRSVTGSEYNSEPSRITLSRITLSRITRYSLLITLLLIVLVQPLLAAVRAFPQLDRSRAWEVYDYGQDALSHVVPDGQVVGLLGETTLLRYFRDVLGRRPDVVLIPADAEAARLAAVDAALAAARPVYLTRDLPGAAGRYSLDAAGPLIAVSLKARPAPVPPGQPVAAGIVLADAQTTVRRTHAGPVVRLTLTWAASAPVKEELKVSARLLDDAGHTVAQDDRVPVHFAYPTTAWVPGELVQDVYDLALPPASPARPGHAGLAGGIATTGPAAGPYDVLLILYRAADGSEVGRVQFALFISC